jgi:hypothetical protein
MNEKVKGRHTERQNNETKDNSIRKERNEKRMKKREKKM